MSLLKSAATILKAHSQSSLLTLLWQNGTGMACRANGAFNILGRCITERIVKEDLGRPGWLEEKTRSRGKGHRGKVMIERRLRWDTIMSSKWIATRLQMGTWTYGSNLRNGTVEPSAQEVLPSCQ